MGKEKKKSLRKSKERKKSQYAYFAYVRKSVGCVLSVGAALGCVIGWKPAKISFQTKDDLCHK